PLALARGFFDPLNSLVSIAKQSVVGGNIQRAWSGIPVLRAPQRLVEISPQVSPLGRGVAGRAIGVFDGRDDFLLPTKSQRRQPFGHGFSQPASSLVDGGNPTMTILPLHGGARAHERAERLGGFVRPKFLRSAGPC